MKFRLKELYLNNFLSFKGEHYIPFDAGVTLIHGTNLDKPNPDGNASGKTGLLRGINYAIRGELAVSYKVADLAHHGTEGYINQLTLVDEVSGKELVIYRLREKRKTEFWWEFDSVKVQGDPRQTQQKLNKFLGLPPSFYEAVVFLHPDSKSASLRTRKSTERIKLFESFVDNPQLTYAGEKVSEKIQELDKLQTQYLSTAHTYRGLVDQTVAEISELRRQESVALEAAKHVQQRTEGFIKENDIKILNLQKSLRALPDYDTSKLRAELGAINMKLEAHNLTQSKLRQLQSATHPSSGTHCPTCFQLVSEAHLKTLEEDRNRAIGVAQQESRMLEPYTERKKQIVDLLKVSESVPYRKQAIQAQITQHQTENYAAREKVQDQSLYVIQSDLSKAAERLTEYRGKMTEADTEVGNLNKHLPILRTLKVGFTREIKSMLLEELRHYIDRYTRVYTSHICPDGLEVVHVTETPSGKECWELEIQRHGVPNPLTSGAESLCIDLSLALSTRMALLNYNACKLNFLLIDDFFGRVADAGCAAITELLHELHYSGTVSNILVTTPREIGLTGRSMRVTKERGESRVG